jgi:5-methylcytosine-specific restriction protein A
VSLHGGRRWRDLRLRILARDGYECQIRAKGCTRVANQVDHIVELADGGAKYDPRNLRASCAYCNMSRGAAFGNARRDRKVSRKW